MSRKFDRVFVVAHARSGSTLLQGLLNAIPGYRIFGENAAFLLKLQESFEALCSAHQRFSKPKNDIETHAWFGSSRYGEAFIIPKFTRFVDQTLFQVQFNIPFDVFGFKEIRFDKLDTGEMDSYLAFVRKLYPNSAIVFNTRNIGSVANSGMWRKKNRWARESHNVSSFQSYCEKYAKDHTGHSIHISYDDLILRDRKEVSRLLLFLGVELGNEEIENVFKTNHSSHNRVITSYIAGRIDYITINMPEWWQKNIEEFRIDVDSSPAGYVVAGDLIPVTGSNARLFLESGGRRTELVGTRPTPKIAALFSANPAASHARFQLQTESSDVFHLFGETEKGAVALVAVIDPRRASSAGVSERDGEPGEAGAGKPRKMADSSGSNSR